MIDLVGEEKWEEVINGYDVSTPVEGGQNGASNIPIKQLDNRTLHLNAKIGLIGEALDEINGEVI